MEPFSFTFDPRNNLLVTEGNFITPKAGAMASYRILEDGSLETNPPASVRNFGSDTCWVVVTDNGRFAYTQSTVDSKIESYRIKPDGTLVLLDSEAAYSSDVPETAGGFDLALSKGSGFRAEPAGHGQWLLGRVGWKLHPRRSRRRASAGLSRGACLPIKLRAFKGLA